MSANRVEVYSSSTFMGGFDRGVVLIVARTAAATPRRIAACAESGDMVLTALFQIPCFTATPCMSGESSRACSTATPSPLTKNHGHPMPRGKEYVQCRLHPRTCHSHADLQHVPIPCVRQNFLCYLPLPWYPIKMTPAKDRLQTLHHSVRLERTSQQLHTRIQLILNQIRMRTMCIVHNNACCSAVKRSRYSRVPPHASSADGQWRPAYRQDRQSPPCPPRYRSSSLGLTPPLTARSRRETRDIIKRFIHMAFSKFEAPAS